MPHLPNPDYLALYGSLRRGQPAYQNLGLERLLRYAGPCTLQGTLHDFGDWPGLVEGKGRVTGELYDIVDGQVLDILDTYEACNPVKPESGLFRREVRPLLTPRNRFAHIYFYNRRPGSAPVIKGGDWLAHLKARERALR